MLYKYEGTYVEKPQSLYQILRKLFSLSHRPEILNLIAHIINYQIYVQENAEEEEKYDDDDLRLESQEAEDGIIFTEYQKMSFAKAIEQISQQVYSPNAKVICYMQQLEHMIPNVCGRPADEVQDAVMKLILNIDRFETIENLYIDLPFIQNFTPKNLLIGTQFITFTHLISALTMILNNGFEDKPRGEEESDEEEEDDGMPSARQASKVDQIDNI